MVLVCSLKAGCKSSSFTWAHVDCDEELGMEFCGLCDSLFSWGKSFPLIHLYGVAMRIMPPCWLGMLFEILWHLRPTSLTWDTEEWKRLDVPRTDVVGSKPWAVSCKVAYLGQYKAKRKSENSATGSVWLFLHVEDFQGLSNETV